MKTQPPYRSVVQKFLLWIVPPLALLMATLGLALSWYDLHQVNERNESYRKQVLEQLASQLVAPLHFFEYKVIETIADTVINNENINYFHVTDDLKNTVSKRGSPGKLTVTRDITNDAQTVFIGHLEIGFREKGKSENPSNLYAAPWILALLFLLVLTILIYATWNYVVAKPLKTLRVAMEQSKAGAEQCIELDSQDEFGLIASAYNDMIVRLREHRKAIYETNNRLEQLAKFDQLTALLNQHAFREQAESYFAVDTNDYWLLFIDLDRFKWINDSYGHPTGDAILKWLAKRLQKLLPDALISRFGGDEFVLLYPTNNGSADQLFSIITNGVRQQVCLQGIIVTPTVSIGGAHYPKDADNYDDLLQKADTAMYQAKLHGRGTGFMYTAHLDQKIRKYSDIINILHSQCLNDLIEVYFQPIIDSRNGRIVSAEALCRLNGDEYQHISIQYFLTIAEEAGYINKIDSIVRKKSMEHLSNWRSKGLLLNHVHINLSPLNFKNLKLADEIANELKQSGMPGESIILEITESAFISNPENAITQLEKLQQLGIRIALDDFGTGYSSLSMLTNFPIAILKLDQSFFFPENGSNSGNQHLVVKHVIAMARSLDISVIAEGVETQQTIDRLSSVDCYLLQGFKFYTPMNHDAFSEVLLSTQRSQLT